MTELKQLDKPLNQTLDKSPNIDTGGSDQKSTGQTLVNPDDNVNRPSIRGAFRPVRNGTIRGSIYAFLTSAIGTGCLNLPVRVHELGIFPYIIVLCLAGLLSFLGVYFMELMISKYKVQSYAEMVSKAFGHQKRRYSEFVLIFFTWAVTICTEVIFIKFTMQLLHDVLGCPFYENRDHEIYNALGDIAKIIVGLIVILLNAKNFMKTDLRQILHTIGKSSVIGISTCLGLVMITAVFGFTRHINGQQEVFNSIFTMDYNLVERYHPLNQQSFKVFLQATAAVFFSFLGHPFVFPIINSLKRPSRKRVEYIFFWSHYQLVLIYFFYSIMGYLLLAQHRDILPFSSLVITSIPTFPLIIGKIMVTFAMCYRIPLQFFTTKQFIYESMDIQRNDQNLKKINLVLSASSIIIAILFQNINIYFALIGGTFGLGIACLMPMACVIKSIPINNELFWILIFSGVMCTICFIGAMLSVLKLM